MKKYIKTHADLIFPVLVGLLLLVIVNIECLTYIRYVLGILFVFFLSGYSVSVIVFPKKDLMIEKLMISIGASLMMTYPACIITAAIEGKTGEIIYQPHLLRSLSVLVVISLITTAVALFRRKNLELGKFHIPKQNKVYALAITGVIALSSVLNFTNLSRATLNGDEYDIGYRSYYLIDGIMAGRKGYLLSFEDHTPLAAFINHFSMQILNPLGFEGSPEWIVRFAAAFTGVLCVALIYILGKEIFNKKVGLWAGLLLAVSNYHVWTSRIFLREAFMTLFILLSIYFLFKMLKAGSESKKTRYAILTGLFLGGLLLTKITGIFIFAAILLFLFLTKNLNKKTGIIFGTASIIFSPIIAYNAGAYIMTGYMDIFFSRIFGIYHPFGYTGDKSHTTNFTLEDNVMGIFKLLIDQYSLVLFALFAAATLYALLRFKRNIKNPAILFQILLAITIIVFFILSGTRAYYMPFITIPFALITGHYIAKIKHKIPTLCLLILITGYGVFYTYNTNISSTYTADVIWNDSGRPGTENLTIEPLTYHYSRSTRRWVEDYGWRELKDYIEEIGEDTFIIVYGDMSDQMLQYYLDIQHSARQHYLENEYNEKYNNSTYEELLENPKAGILITTAAQEMDYNLLKVIENPAGDPQFNVYQVL